MSDTERTVEYERGFRAAVKAMTRLNTELHSRDVILLLKAMIDLGMADELAESEAVSAYWHTEDKTGCRRVYDEPTGSAWHWEHTEACLTGETACPAEVPTS